MKNKKILIIGSGSIGKRHIKNLQSLGYKNLFCLKRKYDSKFEEKYNVTIINSYDDAMKFNFNVIFICTPSSLHIKDLKFAFSQDSDIFIEKPLVTDLESYQYLKSVDFKRVLYVGFMLRCHPLLKKLKSFLDNVDNVYFSRFEFGSYLPNWPYKNYKESYTSKIDLGGGVTNTICHELDLALFLFGSPKSIFTKKINSNIIKIEAEDISESILSYDDHLCSLHMDYLQKDFYRKIYIQSKKYNIYCDLINNHLTIKNLDNNTNKEVKLEKFDTNKLYINEVKDFFNLIDNDIIKHSLDFDYALMHTKYLLKMHTSAKYSREIYNE